MDGTTANTIQVTSPTLPNPTGSLPGTPFTVVVNYDSSNNISSICSGISGSVSSAVSVSPFNGQVSINGNLLLGTSAALTNSGAQNSYVANNVISHVYWYNRALSNTEMLTVANTSFTLPNS